MLVLQIPLLLDSRGWPGLLWQLLGGGWVEGAGGRAVVAGVLVLRVGGFDGEAEGDAALMGVGGALRLGRVGLELEEALVGLGSER